MNVSQDNMGRDLLLPHPNEFLATTLRNLYLAVASNKNEVPRSKEELVEALVPHMRDDSLAKMLAHLEATQPFRHCFIFEISDTIDTRQLIKLLGALENNLPMNFGAPSNLHYLGWLNNDYFLLRFAIPIVNSYQVPDGEDRWKIETSSVRHPVIVAVKPQLGVVEIRFNGYEQGKFTSAQNKVTYRDLAGFCTQFLASVMGIAVKGLALKDAVEELLANSKSEVTQSKNNSRIGRGRISLDVGDFDDSGDLTELIKEAFNIKTIAPDSNVAMRNWTAENVTLAWVQYRLLTRIDYTGETPELFFSWRDVEHRSLKNLDLVIKQLLSFADLDQSKKSRKIDEVVRGMRGDEVLTVLDVAQRASSSPYEALEYLIQLVESRRLVMKFRVRTNEYLVDRGNNWLASMSEMPRVVTTESGRELDLLESSNVEVGFALIGSRQ